MNDELDVMRRLVDYHDHISAPLVPVADDLHRGRRRVRRNRGLVAGGVALGLASVAAAVSLVTGGDPAERPQPVGPPSPTSTFSPNPDNPGLTAPLIAPESLLEVQELGFRVEGPPTLGARLLADRQSLEVAVANSTFAVEVYYQGRGPGLLPFDKPRQDVSINGLAGTFVERFENNGYLAYVVWEYAPDAWAAVRRIDAVDTPERKAQVLAIAEAIRPGGEAVRVPFRIGTTSAPLLRAETVAEVDIPRGTDFWFVSFDSGLGISGAPARRSTCRPPTSSERLFEAFTYAGHSGCLQGADSDPSQVAAVVLQVDGTALTVHNRGAAITAYDIEDLKLLLADITVAASDDRSTWFDLTTAFGG